MIVYTLSGCVHCERAKALLRRRGILFREVHGDGVHGFRRRLRELTGRSTVPQILVDGAPVGGASSWPGSTVAACSCRSPGGERFPRAIFSRRLNPVGLLTAPFGGSCGMWRHRVELVERDGRVLERFSVRSDAEAEELAVFLNEREAAA